MLLSTKDQGRGRRRRSYSHSHVYSMNTNARSSKLSLLSAITTQSTGSNGSSSTVTQESYNKSRSETSRKRRSSKRKRERPRSNTPPMEALEEAISEGEDEHEDVDVFAFLVEEAATKSSDEMEGMTTNAPAETARNEKDSSDLSLHSDSGISMDDGSIVLGQTTLKPLLSTLPEYRPLEHDETSQIRFDWTWPDVPKSKHASLDPPRPPHHWDGIEYPREGVQNGTSSPQVTCFTPDSPNSRRQSLMPYDSLVATSSHSPGPPLKAFTQTCQRLLLELQQEVSELDNELKQLEAYLMTMSPAGTEPMTSSDRRGSWQWGQHPSELYAIRRDIIGRLHMKLEHYYRLLLLSQKVRKLRATSSASAEHVARFRARLKELRELVPSSKEALLAALNDEEDLITLEPDQATTAERVFYDSLGRIFLGVAVLTAAGSLQVVSGLGIKMLIGVQMVATVVALCLPLQN